MANTLAYRTVGTDTLIHLGWLLPCYLSRTKILFNGKHSSLLYCWYWYTSSYCWLFARKTKAGYR